MYRVINVIENKEIFAGSNVEFVRFAEKINRENEDYQFSILGLSDAITYIEDYCDNLKLIIT